MLETEILFPYSDAHIAFVFEGIANGEYVPPTESDIRALVQSELKKTVPILQLPVHDEDFLREVYIAQKFRALQNKTFFALAGQTVFVEAHSGIDPDIRYKLNMFRHDESYVLTGPLAITACEEFGMRLMTKKEKIDLLTSNIDRFNKLRVIETNDSGGSVTQDLYPWGTRNFFEDVSDIDTYGVTKDEFTQQVRRIQQNTNFSIPVVVDMGFGNGKALHQIQTFSRNVLGQEIETVGLGLEQAMNLYPVGKHIFGPIERMPVSLYETADILISNRAFEYFTFPDIGLFNALLTLKVGGWAKIEFAYEDSFLINQQLFYPDFSTVYEGALLEDRIQKAFDATNELSRRGFISLSSPFPSTLPNMYCHYHTRIVKHGSIPRDFFLPYI